MPTTEFESTEVITPSAIESVTRGEVDIQVVTAKRYPRSLTTFRQRGLDLATLDQDTAESCIYALPRDGKTIEGPSARFAEIMASTFGNLRIEGRPIDDDGKFVAARGTAWDIQNNVLIAFETKRSVTDKRGKRYKDDMVGVTTNAAVSISIRNAVLKVIPKPLWQPIYEACRKAAVGDASTLVNRRAAMLVYFLKLGASNDQVFALLEVAGVEDITLDHLGTLKGLATAIKEGDTTVDQAFAPKTEPAAEVKRASAQLPTVPPNREIREGDIPVRGDVIVSGQVHELEEGTGCYWLTLRNGERLSIDKEKEEDVAELLKFGGTDHFLRFTCKPTTGNGLALVAFAIAD